MHRLLSIISLILTTVFAAEGVFAQTPHTESGRDPEIYKLFRSNPDYSAYYTYDLNSNPETIFRYGVQDKSSDDECVYLRFGMIDDLIFHRDGNRLNAIVDDGSSAYYAGATDFVDDQTDADEYEYDANGNVIFDLNRGIDHIAYNELNLPAVIVSKNAVIKNFYDTGGRLISRVTQQTGHDGFSSREPVTTTDVETYVNGFTFKTGSGDWQLKRIDTPTGFINPAGEVYSFVKDYQGNVRQVLNERGGVVQESDYYPYGMLFGESDVNGSRSDINRRRYSGKEYISAGGLNLYDFSARYFSPDGPGFLGSDPMQADYASLSPTAYCAADPINYIDPTGEDIYTIGTDGALVSRYEDDTDDLIIIGEQKITLPYGTIQYEKVETVVNGENRTYSYYTVNNSEKAKDFFEFVANNCTTSDVDFNGHNLGAEISWAVFGTGKDELNIISTASTEKGENSFPYFFTQNWEKLPPLKSHTHSHTKLQTNSDYQNPIVSKAPNPSSRDLINASSIRQMYRSKGINHSPTNNVYYKGFYTPFY